MTWTNLSLFSSCFSASGPPSSHAVGLPGNLQPDERQVSQITYLVLTLYGSV